MKFQNSKSHSGAGEFKIQNLTSPELKFKIQNLTPPELENSKFKIQNPPGAEFQNPLSSGAEFQNSKFKILSAPELNFKILSAPELNFKIQNPLSSGAGEFKIQNLTLRSWNFKVSKSHSPELEFQNSKFKISLSGVEFQNPPAPELNFKILQLRRVKFQNPPAPESEISKFKISLSGVEFQNPPAPESEISKSSSSGE